RSSDLAAKAGVDRHQHHQVQVLQHPVQHLDRGGRVEHQAGLAAMRPDQLDGAVDVAAGLRVEADEVGAGGGEVRDDAVHRLDHQVHVDEGLYAVLAQRLADHRADGEVGDVVVVHH